MLCPTNLDIIRLHIVFAAPFFKPPFFSSHIQPKPIFSVSPKSISKIIEGQNLDHLESDAIYIFPSIEGQQISTEYIMLKSNGKNCLIIDRSTLHSKIYF